ncbi:DUF1990 family protein [Glycomyces tenuis]|uniref:DUF1990 family protein n=1 Tax=Glycomyces tenuis TaxID=58116 RepID=UPI000414EBF9|nr:DUF1990 domain-containing protein [Glycomyces tenuis]
MDLKVNYPEAGATRGAELPAGYRHLEVSTGLDAPLEAAAEVLMTWRLHERCGYRPVASAPRAAAGVEVTLAFAWTRMPCQVVWAVESAERCGFAYGSMDGHFERGEAAFVLDASEGRTRFTVRSFSRPGHWASRLGGPVARAIQTRFTGRFLSEMRSACAER